VTSTTCPGAEACRYYDLDGVVCNEEPGNCPLNREAEA